MKYYLKSKKSGKYVREAEYVYLVECDKKDAKKFTEREKNYAMKRDPDLEPEEVK